MAKSRAREAIDVPPAKRRKAAQDDNFESVLLNKKGPKPLPAAHTTKPISKGSARIGEENVVVNGPDANGDVPLTGGLQKQAEDELSEDGDENSSDESDEENDGVEESWKKSNGIANGVDHMDEDSTSEAEAGAGLAKNGDGMDEDEDEDEEATFEERLHAQHAEPIDVEAELARQDSTSGDEASSKPAPKTIAKIPSGATFSTVLTQALRTNDAQLLNTCFDTSELTSVRTTLSRLDSTLVPSLLSRIAERISRAPGRLGNLMVWIQWAVIAHGGYLAAQPDLRLKLRNLHKVIEERAKGLGPLLQLKGKLDMLAAQVDLRREEVERNARRMEDEQAEVTIYVEGESSDEEDSEDEVEMKLLTNGIGGEEVSDDEVEAGAFAKAGVRGDVSDSSESEEGLFDEEASEDDEETSEEDEDDEDEEDSD